MQDLSNGIEMLVHIILKEKPGATLEEVKQTLFIMEPNLKNEKIFLGLIHSIYGIAQCDIAIAKKEKPTEASCPLTSYRIIGISGKIGAGKTTLSSYIQYRIKTLEPRSFAENLRKMVSILINRPVDNLRTIDDKEKMTCMGKTVGVLLQQFGTEVGRAISADAWVLSLFEYYDADESRWIIDDVRFPNEADHIKKMGGIVIRLNGDPGGVRKNTTRDLDHPSETALDDYTDFDVVLNTEEYMHDTEGIFEAINNAILSK